MDFQLYSNVSSTFQLDFVHMKNVVLFLAILTAIISCSKGSDKVECDNKVPDKGIIISSVDFGPCVYKLNHNTFVIQDSIEYAELQKEITESMIVDDTCNFPKIRFNDSIKPVTLLGQYAEATGCTVTFNRNVEVDSTNKKVNYIIDAKGCGECDMLGYSYNFVLVQKIDSTYTILFNGNTIK